MASDRSFCIDYRHVIWSLVRKPAAFARYRYREKMFPSAVFRRAFDHLIVQSEKPDPHAFDVLLTAGGAS